MRVLGLDVGSVRIGIAISDEDGIIAQPFNMIGNQEKSVVEKLRQICNRFGIETVVVGLPLAVSGGEGGKSSRRAKALGRAIETKLGLEVVFTDERFSTREAQRALIEGNLTRDRRKEMVDKVSAALILQRYLDETRREFG